MNADLAHILILITDCVIVCLVSLSLYLMLKHRVTDEEIIKARKIVQENERKEWEERYKGVLYRNEKSYERTQVYLSRMGAHFHIGEFFTPSFFRLSKFGFALLFAVCGISIVGTFGCLVGFVGFCFPDIVLNILNSEDNEKMMEDIKALYDSLLISMEAGVFLTEAVANGYKMVENKRLKKALLELNSEIVATNDMELALSKFELKFRNPYVDKLCVILRQQQETGLSLTMIADMSSQMSEVRKAMNIKKKAQLDNQAFLIEFLLFAGILAVCLFVCFDMLASTMTEL